MLLYQILECTILGKISESHTKTRKLKHQLQKCMINLKYLMEKTLYQIFKIIFNISSKKLK